MEYIGLFGFQEVTFLSGKNLFTAEHKNSPIYH